MKVESVQCIASMHKNQDTIPAEFIRSEEDQPGITTVAGPSPKVPVINLADMDEDRVLHGIVEASKEWGIFQVVNHGIPAEVIKELQRVGKEFFDLPQEEKEKIAMVPGHFEGYGTKIQKDFIGKKNWGDFLFHGIWPLDQVDHLFWPKNPPDYRKVNEDYTKYMVSLVNQIFEYLSIGLGLDKKLLKEASGENDLKLLLRINFYPPCPQPDLTLGVGPHTDMSALTLLVPNEIQGLQIFRDGHWFDTEYVPDAMIVNIGDQLEILSNGKYKSVLHRTTVYKDRTRMSWPVFCEPPAEFVIGTLPQLVNEENPAKFKTKKYKNYQYCKIYRLPQ
ncbi:hypothetical protein LUZ60_001281 [Juncus effusus]|nr:hypothetical protein LUZ60_001281 [Juncus effusus]